MVAVNRHKSERIENPFPASAVSNVYPVVALGIDASDHTGSGPVVDRRTGRKSALDLYPESVDRYIRCGFICEQREAGRSRLHGENDSETVVTFGS